MYYNTRKWLWMARVHFYYMLFQWTFRFGFDFKFWKSGLEVKYACEAAENVGAKLHFLGPELDPITWDRLQHETRMNLPHYILKRMNYASTTYIEELDANRLKIA